MILVTPIVRTIASTLTPESAFLRLRHTGRCPFLFESAQHAGQHGRWSFIGSDPIKTIRSRGGTAELTDLRTDTTVKGEFFSLLRTTLGEYRPSSASALPPLAGGWIGYIGYDVDARQNGLHLKTPVPCVDDAFMGLFPTIVAFDHTNGTVSLVTNCLTDPHDDMEVAIRRANDALDTLVMRLELPDPPTARFTASPSQRSGTFEESDFAAAVEQTKKHIVEGDIFQAVLSRRTEYVYEGDLLHLYHALKAVNPSPYMYFLSFEETSVVGTSPEVLVRKVGTRIETYPIAGTRKRGGSRPDEVVAQELLDDPKERAEHVMLVDLGRNDLGRVATPGTVRVESMMDIVSYSHVMHLESRVIGEVAHDISPVDVFRSAFPAGTVTGAPKIRAMQIIRDLEPVQRVIYGGGIGYFDFYGNLDSCIAIRTIIATKKRIAVQAGAGVVYDSAPEFEFMETENKSAAMRDAIALAERMSA